MTTRELIEAVEERTGCRVRIRHLRPVPDYGLLDRYGLEACGLRPADWDQHGGVTIATLQRDGVPVVSASAKCSRRDSFSRRLGAQIAIGRALKEWDEDIEHGEDAVWA